MTARHTLAVGLEPVDATGGTRLPFRFRVALDATARGLPRPGFARHPSGLQVLLAYPGLARPIELRLFDDTAPLYAPKTDRRRFVPRRLSVPVLPPAQWGNPEADGRARRPHLFPGAAYDVTDAATALRGRVTRAGVPVRWVRVEARTPAGVPVGFAHGDDRGEFLLIPGPPPAPPPDPAAPLDVRVVVWGRAAAPVPAAGEDADPLWDLPLEPLAAAGAADPVAAGRVVPGGYVQLAPNLVAPAAANVTLTPGRTTYQRFAV